MNKRKVLRIGLITVLAIAAGNFGWGIHANSQLSSALKSVRSAGIPLSMEELMGERPAKGNRAAHLYLAGITLCRAAGSLEDTLDGYEASHSTWHDQSPPASLVQALPALDEGIAMLQRALAEGECYLPMPPGDKLEGRTQRLDLFETNHLATIFAAATLVHVEAGDLPRARQAFEAGLALTEALRHEPLLIAQMIRMAYLRMSIQSAMLLAPYEEDLQAWSATLAPLYEYALKTNTIADALASEVPYFTQLMSEVSGSEGGASLLSWTPYLKSAQASYLEYMSAAVENARLPLPGSIETAEQLALDARENGSALAAQFAISTDGMLVPYAECSSRIHILQLGNRALAFRKTEGRWPAKMSELGDDLPLDPLTGSSFELELTGTELTIRSTAEPYAEKGDITWTLR